MKGLCIFDFDGTTVNTLQSIADFGNRALKAHGLRPLATELYRKMVGNGASMLLKRMIRASLGEDSEDSYRKVKETYDALYESDPTHLVVAYEGIPPLLRRLRREGWLLAVNSNKPDGLTRRIAVDIFGEDAFDCILGQRDDIPKKPAPDGAELIIRSLGADKKSTFYIGDSDVDVQTGKRAGVRVIGAAWGFRGYDELKEAGADDIARRPEEIPLFLK